MRTAVELPKRAKAFPQLRFMGSKYRLLPWIHSVLRELRFETALDGFSGSGSVGYLLKTMGKQVAANDRLHLSHTIATAVVENSDVVLSSEEVELLLAIRNFAQNISGFVTPWESRTSSARAAEHLEEGAALFL